MTDTVADENQQQESHTSPGVVLRGLRESKGLSQTDVASRLHLSMQTIKDIEGDDYSHFSAIIYVRGYLRSYAGLLEIDSKPLLAAFDEMGFSDQISPARRTSYIASSITKTMHLNRSRRRIARWMSWLIVGFLVALVAAWWYGQRHHKHATISDQLLTQATPVATIMKTKIAPVTAKSHAHKKKSK